MSNKPPPARAPPPPSNHTSPCTRAAKYFSSSESLSEALSSKYGISLNDGVAAASAGPRTGRVDGDEDVDETGFTCDEHLLVGDDEASTATTAVTGKVEGTDLRWQGDSRRNIEGRQCFGKEVCEHAMAQACPGRLRSVLKPSPGAAAAQASPRGRRIRWNEEALEGEASLQRHRLVPRKHSPTNTNCCV